MLSPWCSCSKQCDINITSFLTKIQKCTYTYFTAGVKRKMGESKECSGGGQRHTNRQHRHEHMHIHKVYNAVMDTRTFTSRNTQFMFANYCFFSLYFSVGMCAWHTERQADNYWNELVTCCRWFISGKILKSKFPSAILLSTCFFSEDFVYVFQWHETWLNQEILWDKDKCMSCSNKSCFLWVLCLLIPLSAEEWIFFSEVGVYLLV